MAVVAVEPPAGAVGSGLKVIVMANVGSEPGHEPPLALPPDVAPAGLVELCSVTSLTPSIRRRRASVWATSDWLIAQPLMTKTGTLPGGVADVTADALGAAEEEEEVVVVEVAAPTVPLSDEIDAKRGSTRPSSWKA